MIDRLHIVLIAIVGLVTLEAIALIKGVDGQLFATVVGAIAGIVGYLFGATTSAKKENGDEQ